ncbi:EF-hand domain-containing protein [Streptomyces sp. NPDC093085]|uniref:EF-hand domain-containing protein n=1 Tax=Streptomyces sp. NPDC093085 TaxID=3155068 RepID=UPI00343B155E
MTTAAQPLVTTKLERQFDALDADRDGTLEWSDYQSLCDRYLTAYRLTKDDHRARGLQAMLQMNWTELLRHASAGAGEGASEGEVASEGAHRDRDPERLTKDQFVEAARLASFDTSRFNVAEGSGHAIFDVIDADGDNEISGEEFGRLVKDVWKSEAPGTMEAFHRLDTDGDGVISRQEFIRAMREYYFSDDPEAPGSLFFGRV